MMASKLDGVYHLRANPRFKKFQPTEMKASNAIKRVHLLNLSAGGALVYAAEPPEPGTPLKLQLDNQHRTARVVWADDRRFGIAFVQPLAAAQVEQVIASQEAAISAASQRICATMNPR
jgi:hypothetical protein